MLNISLRILLVQAHVCSIIASSNKMIKLIKKVGILSKFQVIFILSCKNHTPFNEIQKCGLNCLFDL
jgi:hypothetical protein